MHNRNIKAMVRLPSVNTTFFNIVAGNFKIDK